MITAKCHSCGGAFRLDDSLAGRRAKCKRCGAVFTIPDNDPFDAGDDGLLKIAGEDDDNRPVPPAVSAADPNAPQTSPEDAPFVLNHAADPEQRAQAWRSERDVVTDPTRSFWADAGIAFIVPFRGSGIILFFFVVFFMVVSAFLDLAGCIGLLGQIIIGGWLCAYYFLVIQSTCTGEDHLPPFEIEGGFDGIVRPIVAYWGALAWAGLPFLAWSWIMYEYDVFPGNGDRMVWFGLMALAIFIWPMTILSVAINGFTMDVLRYDKQLVSIGRSLLPYAAIFVMLVALTFLTVITAGFGSFVGFLVSGASMGTYFAIRLGLIILAAYVDLTTMRLIGLFYRHNKRRFAWLAE